MAIACYFRPFTVWWESLENSVLHVCTHSWKLSQSRLSTHFCFKNLQPMKQLYNDLFMHSFIFFSNKLTYWCLVMLARQPVPSGYHCMSWAACIFEHLQIIPQYTVYLFTRKICDIVFLLFLF